VWGWILRIAVAGSLLIIPFVITSMTTIVEHGTQVQTLAAKYTPQLATISVIDPGTLAQLTLNPADSTAIGTAVGEISTKAHVSPAVAIQRLVAVGQVPKADLAYLTTYGATVQKAVKSAPSEWQRWWWLCFAAEGLMVPTIFLLKGPWSPKTARQDEAAHKLLIETELANIGH
jgi:hypothetical protein